MSDRKQETNSEIKGLEAVVLRNAFYSDHLKISRLVLYVLLFINICLGYGIYYKITNPPEPQFFPATEDGMVFKEHAYSDPVVGNDFVEQWAMQSLRTAFSLDYLHWESQLTQASYNFTKSGWIYFLDAFKQNNNLSSIEANQLVCDIKLTGSPNIINQGVVNGIYTWNIEVPVELIFSGKISITQTAMVTMLVQRANVVQYPQRIAINQILVNQEANSVI